MVSYKQYYTWTWGDALKRITTPLLCLLMLVACNKELSQDQLETYLQDEKNGTSKTFKNGDYTATVVYRPTDLLVKQELDGGNKNVETLKKKYAQYQYFVLSLQNKGSDFLNSTASNRTLFAAINEQLSFHLNENIYLVNTNKDTAFLTDFAFPRLYEMSKATTVLLVFKAKDIKTETFKICIRDIGYTTSVIEFEFDKKHFKNIPTLKL